MTLHNTSEALTLGNAGYVNLLGVCEVGNGYLIANVVLACVVNANLAELANGSYALLCEVTSHGLVHLVLLDGTEAQLYSLITIGCSSLDLADGVRCALDNGYGNDAIVLIEDLGHAQLGSVDSVNHSVFTPYSLISMSTPAGRSRRIRESTVLGVGSRMSIRRL